MSDYELAPADYLPSVPETTDFRIGCIGAGFIMADCHLVAYGAAGIHAVGIASRSKSSAEQVASRHHIPHAYDNVQQLLDNQEINVLDIAVPPDSLLNVIQAACERDHVRGILAQKPLGVNLAEAKQIVALCQQAGITLSVNQNMRYDQSVRAATSLLRRHWLGEPVLASIDMRAIPHWMPWQERQGWVTCRIMSIHHLDTMRCWFGTPQRVFASFRTDPRTEFEHQDGIGLYILEYDSGLRCMICDDVWTGPAREGAQADLGIHYRLEGTAGLAKGTIGWPKYPEREPSTLQYTLTQTGRWHRPQWDQVWFPDAFLGPMAELLTALANDEQTETSGQDNLQTMALVDACYLSAAQHRAVSIDSVLNA